MLRCWCFPSALTWVGWGLVWERVVLVTAVEALLKSITKA